MDAFLGSIKDVARANAWRWQLVACGSRNEAFDAFTHARRMGRTKVVVLLVDSEDPIHNPPLAHLEAREGWDLNGVDEDSVHLMVQVMETWLVADPKALGAYYGQGFRAGALPRRADLEAVAKETVGTALVKATRTTSKGDYRKIRHASELLQRIDSSLVQQRCSHCARLFDFLGEAVSEA